MTGLAYAVTLIAALGCGLVAGVFFAFSSFVMPALKRLPPAQGISAMQSINRLAVAPALWPRSSGRGRPASDSPRGPRSRPRGRRCWSSPAVPSTWSAPLG